MQVQGAEANHTMALAHLSNSGRRDGAGSFHSVHADQDSSRFAPDACGRARFAARHRPDERPEPPVRWSLAWFPRDEIDAALARWPPLSDDLHDPDAYCRAIEAKLQTIKAGSGARPGVAPLRVERARTDTPTLRRLWSAAL